MFFALYFGFFSHIIADATTIYIVVQIALVIMFLHHDADNRAAGPGIHQDSEVVQEEAQCGQVKRAGGFIIMVLTMIGVISIVAVLAIGAMLLPGFPFRRFSRT